MKRVESDKVINKNKIYASPPPRLSCRRLCGARWKAVVLGHRVRSMRGSQMKAANDSHVTTSQVASVGQRESCICEVCEIVQQVAHWPRGDPAESAYAAVIYSCAEVEGQLRN